MKIRIFGLSLILSSALFTNSAVAGVVPFGQICRAAGVPVGGIVCTVSGDGSSLISPLTTDIGPLSSSQSLLISYLSGSVNLNPMWSDFLFNPDGSLVKPDTEENWSVVNLDYNYIKPGYSGYPTDAGGDGINHFTGGGLTFDKYPSAGSAWGFWSTNLTTDTTASNAVRFGSLVGTLDGGLDWFYIGYGRTIGAGTDIAIAEGSTLSLAVMDAYYGPNSGEFQVAVRASAADVPEPAAMLLAGAGLVAIGVLRRRRKEKE